MRASGPALPRRRGLPVALAGAVLAAAAIASTAALASHEDARAPVIDIAVVTETAAATTPGRPGVIGEPLLRPAAAQTARGPEPDPTRALRP